MTDMPKANHLTKRGKTYYLRMRVPQDVQWAYKGKEITRSLQTSDYKQACINVSLEKVKLDGEFQKHRARKEGAESKVNGLAGYTDHDLTALASSWLISAKSALREGRIKNISTSWSAEEAAGSLLELRQEEFAARQEVMGVSIDDKHDGLTMAAKYLNTEGIPFSAQSNEFRKLGYLFSEAIHEFALAMLKEATGQGQIISSVQHQSPATAAVTVRKTVDAVFKEFIADPGKKLTYSTVSQYEFMLRLVKETVGTDIFIHQITREQCKQIRNLLLGLPKNTTKMLGNVSLAEAVKLADVKELDLMAPATVNGYVTKLSSLLNFAIREGYAQENPAKDLHVADTSKKNKRDPFSEEQLKRIFAAPLFTGCKNDQRGYNQVGPNKPKKLRFWVTMIGLWSGMRLNEICQMELGDIVKKNDVLVINCRETGDDEDENGAVKSLKTDASVRIVPVHPVLLQMGFEDFVNSVKSEGHVRLFPQLKLDKRGYYSSDFSKWFSRFLENIDAKTDTTSYHSFRHTFRDALRENDVAEPTAIQLGGWTEQGVQANYGGKSLTSGKLYSEISKVKYPCVDFKQFYG